MNDQLPSNHSGVRRGVSGGFTAEKDQGLTVECMYTLKHTHTHSHTLHVQQLAGMSDTRQKRNKFLFV